MNFFCSIGLTSIGWSLRRLHCPVKSSDLVLEVGSGGNPYFRSNVLLDAYEDTRERHWVPLVRDRPIVMGFVERLPFRDKAFDFVIAAHVLEHSTDPERFISELQRVAKAGYIEVPDAFMERINPYHDHRLEITLKDDKLVIRKKANWSVDSELVGLYEAHVKKILTKETMRSHPFDFHVRYYWSGSINYEILNPDVDASWLAPKGGTQHPSKLGLRPYVGSIAMKFIRAVFSQHRRNSNIKIMNLLACPTCMSNDLVMQGKKIKCKTCEQFYPINKGIPVMFSKDAIDNSTSSRGEY